MSGDQVVVVSYASFQLSESYTSSEADAEFVTKTGDTMSGNLDVTGTVTSDGLTVDGIATFNAPNSIIRIMESDTTDTNTQIQNNGGDLHIQTVVDNLSSSKDRISLDHATGDISFYEDTGTTAKFFWDASTERLGLGTSSPATKMHIYQGASGVGTSATNILTLENNGNARMALIAPHGSDRTIMFGNPKDSAGNYIVQGGSESGTYDNDYLRFIVGNRNVMKLVNGKVAIGDTNPTRHGQTTKTLIYNDSTTTSDFALHVGRLSTGAENQICITNGYGKVGSVTTSGTSTSYNTSSDYRLKENLVDLTGASARVNQLNPLRFNWITDETNTAIDGFLAHEVATVVPEAINGTKDAMRDEEYEVTPAVLDDDGNVTTEAVMGTRSVPDYQGIDQSKLVPLLTAALQEALAEIESLKTRVQALEDV